MSVYLTETFSFRENFKAPVTTALTEAHRSLGFHGRVDLVFSLGKSSESKGKPKEHQGKTKENY